MLNHNLVRIKGKGKSIYQNCFGTTKNGVTTNQDWILSIGKTDDYLVRSLLEDQIYNGLMQK